MSSLGPMLGMQLGMKFLNVAPDLAGLDAKRLLVFSVLGALCTSVMHTIYFNMTGMVNGIDGAAIPMFVGDLAGTAIVLYTASFALRYIRAPSA